MNDIIGRYTMNLTKKRDIALDYSKGFAIILIVVYHIYGYTVSYKDSIVFSFCQTVQLPIFFYVSGILTGKDFTTNINLKNKFIRLVIPFLFFYFIWCIINYQDLYNFIKNEFKGGYWFILVLFEMMVLYAFSFSLSKKLKIDIKITLISVYIILSLYKYLCPKASIINLSFSINLLWHYFPFFYIGVFHSFTSKILKIKFSFIYLVVFLCAQFVFFKCNMQIIIPICNLFSLLFFTSLFFNGVRPLEKIISRIGEYSLQIYLLHFFLVYYLSAYIPIVKNRLVELLFYLLISIVFINIIIVVSNVFMKNKWTRLLLFGIKQ